MSFTHNTKDELLQKEYHDTCCHYAQLAGIITFAGVVTVLNGSYDIKVFTENSAMARNIIKLCKLLFGVQPNVNIKQHKNQKAVHSYILHIPDAFEILQQLGLLNNSVVTFRIANEYLERACCAGAFVRGAFLGGGSVSDPERRYHLEFVTGHYKLSKAFVELLAVLDINAKTIMRKSNYIIYFKDSESICDVLALMGAGRAVMDIYNIRIIKELKNQVNRVNNFENANMYKMVDAGVKQMESIKKIERKIGLDKLPPGLLEIARLRLDNADISLVELGKMMDPPLGKSGVNHRIRRLMELADTIG